MRSIAQASVLAVSLLIPSVSPLTCTAYHPLTYHPQATVARRAILVAVEEKSSELRVKTYSPTAKPIAATLRSRLQALRALSEAHGIAHPSADNASPSLIRWAARQRRLYKQGTLPADIVDALDALDFVWDPLQAAWDARFEELELFYDEHGHCNLPSEYAPSPALPGWVNRQRQLHRKGTLQPKRRDALVALDFIFDPQAARFEERLAQYSAAEKSKRVMPEALRQWAARQRRTHAAGQLPPERAEALMQVL